MATPSVALNRIGETHPSAVLNWDQELKGARMLMASGLLPKEVKSPEAALFIILAGRDLGLSAVQSLRSIYVIQGKVEVAADMQLGLFHRAGGRSRWLELTNDRAVVELHAPWLVKPHTETFTLEDAKRAGLSGDNWRKFPKAMLRSRAITAGLKSVGFDPTAGVYDYGELGGEEVPVTEDVATVEANGEPTDVDLAGTAEMVEQPVRDEVIADARERQALADIETMLPSLTLDQQIYVKEKLADGADPVKLLERVKEKVLMAPAGP